MLRLLNRVLKFSTDEDCFEDYIENISKDYMERDVKIIRFYLG